uniref:type II secretion system F family protein n=1 Tax=Dialister massiliensis TaxID=2161821 RepID=UPI000D553102|nr:type II secretion system F family protein [Dialister massiliensis]
MLLALSLAFALAFFFFLVMLIFVARRSSGEEVKRRLDVFRDVEPIREEEENPDDLKRIPLYQRTIGRMLTGMAAFFAQFAPSSIPKMMDHRIMLAGKQGIWKVRPVVGLWFLSMAFWGILAFYYTTKTPTSTVQGLCTIWGGLLFGALLPFGVFNHIIRKRQDLIVRQLPDVLDLLSISVQAGLSLDGAIRKVVERMEGPLIDEFRRMLRDTRMGMSRSRSMKLMAQRCEVQDVSLFVMSVVQSERLGASMSDTLQIQADNMRDLRRQRARTKAMKAPVKMIFPLVFCIFPSIFVVVLLPSLLSLKQTIG